MRSILLFTIVLFVSTTWAQKVDTLTLVSCTNKEAVLYMYHPAKKDKITPAVLICPGGGYHGLAIDQEEYDMAK